MLAVPDACGSKKAAVFGFSDGGQMAFLLAATHPSRVDHIVTFGAYGKACKSPEYPDLFDLETRRNRLRKWPEDWGRGDDIGGTGVHISERFKNFAQANEVLVSRTVIDLMTGNQILTLLTTAYIV
ncbi:MAG: alpha/beta hydrolase [Sneathiella sp.]